MNMYFHKLWPLYLFLGLFLASTLSLPFMGCSQQPEPANPPIPDATGQWYCATIADQPTDPNDSTADHLRAVGYTSKWWPVGYKFKVGFMGNYSATQTNLVKTCAAEWAQAANVGFEYPASGPYDLRISFNSGGGAWSYVGTDAKNISQGSPTINLGWLAKDAYLHELGHALGLLHEHQNPVSPIKWNEPNVIRDLSGPPNNWTVEMIRFNVLNPYPLPNVITTALDKVSIMMYPIPSTWTLDGFSTTGSLVLSAVDKSFIGQRYPFTQPPTTGTITIRKGQVDTLIMETENLRRKIDSTTLQMNRLNTITRKTLGRPL